APRAGRGPACSPARRGGPRRGCGGRPAASTGARGRGPGVVSSLHPAGRVTLPRPFPVSLAPGTPVGRYVIRRKLAEGGMAEIFLAQSHGPEGFEKQVVINRIRSALADDPSFVQMFIAEAHVASKLNHANEWHIFDFDRHEDSYYPAMDYAP